MSIKADCHLHSSHSGDSDASMEEMIQKGIALGLTHMCFTEHNDFDFPVSEDTPQGMFELNPDAYLYDLIRLREKYAGQIRILFGVELGLQPHLMRQNAIFAKNHDYDFIIGSSHVCGGQDPYYPAFYEGRSQEEAYREYFQSVIENLKKFAGVRYDNNSMEVIFTPSVLLSLKALSAVVKSLSVFFYTADYTHKRGEEQEHMKNMVNMHSK